MHYQPVTTLVDLNIKLDDTQESLEAIKFDYSTAMGSLQFIQTLSQPDISFAVNMVAQFSLNLQRAHFQAVSRIFLARTIDLSLCYDGHGGNNILEAYTDADYAGGVTDRKSRSGSLLLLNKAPVAWNSRKQTCVATLTIKSHNVAANSSTKDVIWM
jgi:hypothetical protein